ncbi:MAG: restriction endonuclease subunit S [Bacteroidales bacterium]|nr:restriction endonuclease subunit S [Bacteroidales bacterium]
MSKLQELINKLCPNGVEFKPIWSLTTWDKKFKGVDRKMQPNVISYPYVLANVFDDIEETNGDVKLLTTGIGGAERWTTEEKAGANLCEGEIIAIPWGGTPNVKYYNGKFVTADNRIATSNDTTVLHNKFLYYWLNNNIDLIAKTYRGAGIQHPSMLDVLNIMIPVPPIEVQEEIVRILDSFSDYAAELQAELQARKQQYEYYRNLLLTFNPSAYGCGTDDEQKDGVTTWEGHNYKIQWKKLGEIGNICMCKRILKHQTNTKSGIPFYKIGTFGKVADSYISEDLFMEYKKKYSFPQKGEILISASGTIGRAVIYDGEDAYFQDSNIVWINNDESMVLNKYLYYFYQIVDWNVEGGTIKRLYNTNLSNTPIPIPPLELQEKIVAILDRFETLVNDLTNGLPAEIAAVKDQYEYYRNKLLTFKKLTA